MAMQVLNDPGVGAESRAFGEGINSALQGLVTHKIGEIQKHKKHVETSNGLQALLNISPQQANKYASLDPKILEQIVKQELQRPQEEALAQALGQRMGNEAPQATSQQPQATGQQTQLSQQPVGKETTPKPAPRLNSKNALELAKIDLKQASIKAADERAKKVEAREERKLGTSESKSAREFSEPYEKQAEAAKKNIRDYKSLIHLAKTGNIRSGNTHAVLEKLGLEEFGRNFETQAAAKLMARLGQNASSAFGPGARITNFLEQTFQKSLPTLWNTEGGIIAISESNMLADEALEVKNEERKKLLRESNGFVPFDANDIINERSQSKIDALEDKALKVLEKAVSSTAKVAQNFDKLPKASELPGKRIRFPDGSIRKSDGKEWIKEK